MAAGLVEPFGETAGFFDSRACVHGGSDHATIANDGMTLRGKNGGTVGYASVHVNPGGAEGGVSSSSDDFEGMRPGSVLSVRLTYIMRKKKSSPRSVIFVAVASPAHMAEGDNADSEHVWGRAVNGFVQRAGNKEQGGAKSIEEETEAVVELDFSGGETGVLCVTCPAVDGLSSEDAATLQGVQGFDEVNSLDSGAVETLSGRSRRFVVATGLPVGCMLGVRVKNMTVRVSSWQFSAGGSAVKSARKK